MNNNNVNEFEILQKYKLADSEYGKLRNNIRESPLNVISNPRHKIPRIKVDLIQQILDSNVNKHTTLNQLVEEYGKIDTSTSISKETMLKVINIRLGLNFRKPKLRNHKTLTNRHRCMTAIFLQKFIQIILSGAEIVFIDESSFSNIKLNFRTWCIDVDDNPNFYSGRLKSLGLMMACTKNNILMKRFNEQTNCSEHFKSFLEGLVDTIEADNYLKSIYITGFLWVYVDNASIHKT